MVGSGPEAIADSVVVFSALLDAIDADPAVRRRVADRFPGLEQAAAVTGGAARESSRLTLRWALHQVAVMELTARGAARRQLSWSDTAATLRCPADGFEDRLGRALEAAVADQPATEALRKLVLTP